MRLNGGIIDIDRRDGICSLSFVIDNFSELFSHPSIFTIQDSRFKIQNNKWCFIRFTVLIKL